MTAHITAEQLREVLKVRLRLHAFDLVNGGANASQLRADLDDAADAIDALTAERDEAVKASQFRLQLIEAQRRADFEAGMAARILRDGPDARTWIFTDETPTADVAFAAYLTRSPTP